MADQIRDLGETIRLPFEILGSVLNFFLKYLLEILIVSGAIYFVYWMFKKGYVKNISDYIKKRRGGEKWEIQVLRKRLEELKQKKETH